MSILTDGSIARILRESVEAADVADDIVVTHRERVVNEDSGAVTSDTLVPYTCRGLVVDYTAFERAQSSIEANDRRVLIEQGSLAIKPDFSDTITANGETFRVVRVVGDPANAMWDVQVRG